MAPRTAWVLNLDSDLELAAGARYAPKRSVLEAMRPHVARLAASLLREGDVLVADGSPAGAARGLAGRAYCPTPRAIAALVRAGAEPEARPSVEILRRVSSRAFAAELGAILPGGAFVRALDVAIAQLAAPPPVGDGWRMKRAFGMAGRGQRIAEPAPSAADLAFVRAGLAEGGVQIEPNVAIVDELAIHGLIAPSGAPEIGRLVRQTCDPRGAWLATEPIADPSALGDVAARVINEAEQVARALAGAGYFGPFGVDAFLYRGVDGQPALQPRSEINARYSMGYAVGMLADHPRRAVRQP